MPDRNQKVALLQHAFLHKYNSLAAYVLAAGAYEKKGDSALRSAVTENAGEDEVLAQEIAAAIELLEAVARIEPYAAYVGELNYLTLDYLRLELVRDLNTQLTEYQTALAALSDCPEMALFAKLIAATEGQLARLQA